MIEDIRQRIAAFCEGDAANRDPDGDRYFMEPLVGAASAYDHLFIEYKNHIGDFHETPPEHFRRAFPDGTGAVAVVSWILPINPDTIKENGSQATHPGDRWAHTRWYGEFANNAIRKDMEAFMEERGYRAVAPTIAPWWERVVYGPTGLSSSWSERHAAYAAGLGTFSLSDGFITEAGMAHRSGSIITDAPIEPTERTAVGIFDNCLYHHDGSCGICIKRCPADAITFDGHSKVICGEYTTKIYAELEPRLGFPISGCGLCQSRVPCAKINPVRLKTLKGSG